jgi:formate dehydrogenase subunit gamma
VSASSTRARKLNASLSAGAILVLLGSGLIMNFPDLTQLSWRTGATFVHDWFGAVALADVLPFDELARSL